MNKVYYIRINEDEGMNAISLVKTPAVEYNFLKFSKDEKVKLAFNEDQKIITGVVCLADTPIYRYTEGIGDWYCIFEKDTIKKMIVNYSKNNLWNKINLQHNDEAFVNGIYLIESYIKDSNKGIVPAEFADIPDGSWLTTFYVENDELWNQIKTSGELNGFSLQGVFDLIPAESEFSFEKQPEPQSEDDQLVEEIKRILGIN